MVTWPVPPNGTTSQYAIDSCPNSYVIASGATDAGLAPSMLTVMPESCAVSGT